MKHEVLHLKDFFPELGANGCDPTLALYLPYNSPELCRPGLKRPSILICPGGGYAMVSDREAEPIGLNFLPWGYNVFILTYSIAPNRFPTQLREVAAAMELIHRNAALWEADENRVAIMGFSAGGHLAAHYSTCYDIPQVREMFPESKPVQASILCYPVISGDPAKTHLGSIQNLSGHEALTDEDIALFSNERHVKPSTPPAFLWHTATDDVVPVVNSLLYAQALAEQGVGFSLRIYPKGYHGLATVDDATNGTLPVEMYLAHQWMEEAHKWLKTVF